MATLDASVGNEADIVAPVNFFYTKEGHYPRQLGISEDDGARCSVPEGDSSRSAILGLWEQGVNGLTQGVHLIVLRLAYETFSSYFSVELSPTPDTRFQDLIDAGSIDLAGMTTEQAQSRIRDLVNQKLATLN